MKRVLFLACLLLVSLAVHAEVTETYTVLNPGDPYLDWVIRINRTTIEDIDSPIRDLQQLHNESKQNALDMVAAYNNLLEQLNSIIDEVGLPQGWKKEYIVITYSSTKP
jgi:hypothetical protein